MEQMNINKTQNTEKKETKEIQKQAQEVRKEMPIPIRDISQNVPRLARSERDSMFPRLGDGASDNLVDKINSIQQENTPIFTNPSSPGEIAFRKHFKHIKHITYMTFASGKLPQEIILHPPCFNIHEVL